MIDRMLSGYLAAVDDAAVLQPPEAEAAFVARIAVAIKPLLMPRRYDNADIEHVDDTLVTGIARFALHNRYQRHPFGCGASIWRDGLHRDCHPPRFRQ